MVLFVENWNADGGHQAVAGELALAAIVLLGKMRKNNTLDIVYVGNRKCWHKLVELIY